MPWSAPSRVQYIGSWSAGSHFNGVYNSPFHYSNTPENAVGTSFYGERVTYVYTKAANRGRALVTSDGELSPAIDLYAPNTQWQAEVEYCLEPGYHPIFIGVAGQNQAASSGTSVDLDRFITYTNSSSCGS